MITIPYNEPVKLGYQSLEVRLEVLYYPFFSCLISINGAVRCIFPPLIFGPYKRNSKVLRYISSIYISIPIGYCGFYEIVLNYK